MPENNSYVECNLWKAEWREDEDDRPWVKLKKPPQRNPDFPSFAEAAAFEGKLDAASPKREKSSKFSTILPKLLPRKTNFDPFPGSRLLPTLACWGNRPVHSARLLWRIHANAPSALSGGAEAAFDARRAYQSVYALYHDFNKQAEELELVLGVGLLSWAPGLNSVISRHLITLAAEIEFNSKSGALVIDTQNAARKPSVETDMLDPTDLGADKVAEVEKDLADLNSTSRDIPKLHDILPRFANTIGGRGNGAYMADVRDNTRRGQTSCRSLPFPRLSSAEAHVEGLP